MCQLQFLRSSLFGIVLLAVLVPVASNAQDLTADATPNVKEYGRSGYPQVTVYVWGTADTGVWRVEEGTNLLEFASAVTRIQNENRSPDRRFVKWLRVYRESHPGSDPFLETRLEDLFSERTTYPTMEDGDILVLENQARNRFTWREVAQVVGTVGTLLNTYLLFNRIRNN